MYDTVYTIISRIIVAPVSVIRVILPALGIGVVRLVDYFAEERVSSGPRIPKRADRASAGESDSQNSLALRQSSQNKLNEGGYRRY